MAESGAFFLYCLEQEKPLLHPLVAEARGALQTVPAPEGSSEARSSTASPNLYCLGAICSTPARRADLAAALTRFDRDFDTEAGIWVAPPGKAPRDFEAWLKDRSLTLAAGAFAALGSAELNLARVRVDYQTLLERFETLVRRHGAVRAHNRIVAGRVQPTAATVRPTPEQNALSQMLPGQPMGLSEIELYIPDVPDHGGAGDLVLTLGLRHTDIQHSVSLAADQLGTGWNAFRFPRALLDDSAMADIYLHWTGEDAHAPALALGRPNPLPEARVVLNGTQLPAPLAMRVWKAEPGALTHPSVTVDKLDGITAPDTAMGKTLRGDLSWGQLSSLRFVGEKPETAPAMIVSIKEAEGLITIHPVAGAPVTAVVDGIEAGRINRVTGLFHLAYKDCNPVEVAIGLAPESAPDDDLLRYLGPWHRVDPLEWVEANAAPDLPSDGLKRIVVATRMADDKSPAWAWASVARISLS